MNSGNLAATPRELLWIDLTEVSQTRRQNPSARVRQHVMLNYLASRSVLKNDHEHMSAYNESSSSKAKPVRRARLTRTNKNNSQGHGGVAEVPTVSMAPDLQYQPLAPEVRLAAAMVSTLDGAQAGETWFGIVPSRIGHSTAVDLAAHAFVQCIAGTPDAASRRPYLGAISALRDLMRTPNGAQSDDALLTVALLTSFELIAESLVFPILSHVRGLQAILLARACDSELADTTSNELTWTILHAWRILIFARPVALGIPSPFKNQQWRGMKPFNRDVQPKCIEKLQMNVLRMYIGLPSLIVAMRKVQENPQCFKTNKHASRLAKELLLLESSASEKEFLEHCVHVSHEHDLRARLPTSWSFASTTAWETGTLFWAYQILLLRICYKLSNPHRPAAITRDKPAMEADAARMCRSILLSSAFGESTGQYVSMLVPIIAVWGAVSDFSDFSTSYKPGAGEIQTWALDWASKLFDPGLSKLQLAHKLSESAETCVGGPLPNSPSHDPLSSSSLHVVLPIKMPSHYVTNETRYSRASRICMHVVETYC